jgi:aldose 1-epimerase
LIRRSLEKVDFKIAVRTSQVAWALFCIGLLLFALPASAAARVTVRSFGHMSDGTPVDIYTLSNRGIEVQVITYGGIVRSIKVPDKNGKVADVVLGFDALEGYIGGYDPYFGALVGRYANRIAKGQFQLDGQTYSIPVNDGANALHGGPRGFDKVVWDAKIIRNGIELTHVSPDGDQGFPGTLSTTVRYTLAGATLRIEYAATTDKETVVNMTNHSYFNLSGQGSGDILSHEVMIAASRYTPVDSGEIPTGELRSVAGTAFDFRSMHRIGERINQSDDQLKIGHGYDHNMVLDRANGQLARAAEVYDPASGRRMEVLTTEPGLQFYSGGWIEKVTGKAGQTYGKYSAVCLETQHFPDSPNHPAFPSTTLKPGREYRSTTVFRFSAR